MSPTVIQNIQQERRKVDTHQIVDRAAVTERKSVRDTDTLRSQYFAQVRRDIAAASDEVQK